MITAPQPGVLMHSPHAREDEHKIKAGDAVKADPVRRKEAKSHTDSARADRVAKNRKKT